MVRSILIERIVGKKRTIVQQTHDIIPNAMWPEYLPNPPDVVAPGERIEFRVTFARAADGDDKFDADPREMAYDSSERSLLINQNRELERQLVSADSALRIEQNVLRTVVSVLRDAPPDHQRCEGRARDGRRCGKFVHHHGPCLFAEPEEPYATDDTLPPDA